MGFGLSLAIACADNKGFSGGGSTKAPQQSPAAPRNKTKTDTSEGKPDPSPDDFSELPDIAPGITTDSETSTTPTTPDAIQAITATLDNLRWNLPCDGNPGSGRLCRSSRTVNDSKTLAGDGSNLFAIKLRFRGIVEPKTYTGGENDGAFWQIGGSPTSNLWNVYKLEISNPPQVYYLNRADAIGYLVYKIDYEKTVQAYGGAVFTISADTQDGVEATNADSFVVPGVEGVPYNGQFIQINVVSISAVTP